MLSELWVNSMGCDSFIILYTKPCPVVIFPAKEEFTFYTVAEVLEVQDKLDPELVLLLIHALKHCPMIKLMNEIEYKKLWGTDDFTITRCML